MSKSKSGTNSELVPDLSTNFAGLKMANPVTVASGTFGYGYEYADVVDVGGLGAVTVKGIRLEPWAGNGLPRMVEVPGGLVNAIGLQGPGVKGFVEQYMPFLRRVGAKVIVNIWGTTQEEYAEVAKQLSDVKGIHALEVNVSCPNVKAGGNAFGTDPQTLSQLVGAVRAATKLPVIPKLAPNVPDIKVFARVAEEAGADGISLINTLPAMVIDIEKRMPVLSNKVGGLSGPAVHPVAVKLVWEAAQAVDIPILAMGGIMGYEQAIEFFLAGASAVAVGTANFTDPSVVGGVITGISDYMKRHKMAKMSDLVGALR